MPSRLPAVFAVVALTTIGFLWFPGHTWLQADTQIYVPIFERLWDPQVLTRDLMTERPHVSLTLYDEAAMGLRRISGLDFQTVLVAQQVACRALGVAGLYLIATAFGLSAWEAWFTAALLTLGATIGGPSVLLTEYEPVPRGFAVPLLILATGFAVRGRPLAAGVAAAAATLYHAPTGWPFWAVCALYSLGDFRRRGRVWLPLAAAAGVLAVAAAFQVGPRAPQAFFERLDPELESLQRYRASYCWVSVWGALWLPHYAVLAAAVAVALGRLWKRMNGELRWFAAGLTVCGLLSVPASWWLLEYGKWAVIPQIQPMRALLFVTFWAMLLAAAAGLEAARQSRVSEAILWFALAYLVPANVKVWDLPAPNRLAVVAALAVAAALAARHARPALALVAAAAFWLIPAAGGIRNYGPLHTPELDRLAEWARQNTGRDSVFLFPYASRNLEPGVFRATATRALYVDWKTGGQANHFRDLAFRWWYRWQEVMAAPPKDFDPGRYARLAVDYVVVGPDHRPPGFAPAYENARYRVYATKLSSTPENASRSGPAFPSGLRRAAANTFHTQSSP